MLAIRFLPTGKRKRKRFFRVVVIYKEKASKFLKVLGWYNPYTKERSLNRADLEYYIDKLNIEVSDSVKSLLLKEYKDEAFVQKFVRKFEPSSSTSKVDKKAKKQKVK